jgi:hypothetical protein
MRTKVKNFATKHKSNLKTGAAISVVALLAGLLALRKDKRDKAKMKKANAALRRMGYIVDDDGTIYKPDGQIYTGRN